MPELKINNIGVHSRYKVFIIERQNKRSKTYILAEASKDLRTYRQRAGDRRAKACRHDKSIRKCVYLAKRGVYATKTECDNIAYRSVTFVEVLN